jgi:hypothetical protein
MNDAGLLLGEHVTAGIAGILAAVLAVVLEAEKLGTYEHYIVALGVPVA